MKIKYDLQFIKIINLFENITHAQVKDCLYFKDILLFIVKEGDMGKALGKQKSNALRLERMFNKKIKIVEFNPEVLQFTVNLISPLKVDRINEEEGIITLSSSDSKTKGLLIGAQAQNLRNYEAIVKKYFENIKEIKVV
jgi:N utilization substance protein A